MSVLGIDIGAAFVDLALLHDGRIRTAKQAVGERRPGEAILSAIDGACADWSLPVSVLGEIRLGSTGAVNMLLARSGARVGLVTNAGFGDTLALGRQNRADLYDPVAKSPSPTFLVARENIVEIAGRLDAAGQEVAPLSTDEVEAAAARFAAAGIEAVAVCLLFSHVNPAHELACAEILRARLPGVPVALSHEVDGNAREYERTVSTCLEAWLRPSRIAMLDGLADGLAARGFGGRLSLADSRGNLIGPEAARRRVISQIASGPAASALEAAAIAREAGAARAIVVDIGSASTDIVLIEDGQPATTGRAVFAGVPLRLPMTDVESIAVGGSRAVSAQAGGPAFGGLAAEDEPTLTDALVVLAEMPEAAAKPGTHERLAALAGQLGTSVAEAAQRTRDAALDGIASAVSSYAARRNVDPAGVALVASGGLGGLLACALADRLGARRVVASQAPSVSGALGLLRARHAEERVVPVSRPLPDITDAELSRMLGKAGPDRRIVMEIAADPFMHPVRVPLEGEPSAQALREAFVRHFTQRYGTKPAGAGFVFSLAILTFEAETGEAGTARPEPTADAAIDRLRAEDGWSVDEGRGIAGLTRHSPPAAPSPRSLQMRLDAIAQGMQETLFGTAISPVVREGNDAAAALLSLDGEVIALSNAIPLLLGALDGSVRSILAEFPVATLRDGDLYLMNDPYAGGTHLPDITVMRPVFFEGRPVCIAATILHHQDVGGMRAGSVPPDATDIHQEGLRLPPMRMGADGAIAPEMVRLISVNSRAPGVVLGDLAAQIGAANQAANALGRLLAETGRQAFLDGVAQCLDLGEAAARRVLAALPAGPHAAVERLDPMPNLPDVTIRLSLDCAEGRLRADFTGTSAQVPAPINCVRSGPFAASFFSLLCLMGDNPFRNGGVARAIELVLPEACAINAAPPAAVNARMGVVRATTSALLHALGKARPQNMPAANSGMSYVLAFSGRRADGRPFVSTEIIAGGAGGGPRADGASGLSTDVGNAMNMPAEALEALTPLRLVSAEIRAGSGGEGRHRGGDGIRRTYLALADGIAVSLRGERFASVPAGLLGGDAPKPSAACVRRADGREEKLLSRSTPTLNRGDQLIVESCGGAGYGSAGS